MNSERYSKQSFLPQLGENGQEILNDASVLVIGAGGLGTTLLYDLASSSTLKTTSGRSKSAPPLASFVSSTA